MTEHGKSWDVFISHASEDNDTFARPLAELLQNFGVSVWYDEFALQIGGSLSGSIDKGLADSRFGVVVISPHFIKKRWPEYELRGLVSREIDEGRVILPIWHGVSREQVVSFSPTLADKVAIDTKGLKPNDVALQILREVRPDLYAKHSRAELEQLASAEALQDFARALREYEQQIIRGRKRRVLLESCEELRRCLVVFREIFGNFHNAYAEYESALANKGYDEPIDLLKIPYRYSRPTTYGSDYRIEKEHEGAMGILQRLQVDASDLRASIELVRQAWEEADPSHNVSELTGRLSGALDLASYISRTVSSEDHWWIRDKLSGWVTDLPRVEASVEGAITLLESWAKFDPKEEEQGSRGN
jgi:tetratricopeptide (TPR) repeat protein